MDPEERLRILSASLSCAEADFFGRARTLKDLREFLVSAHNPNLAVDKRVREFLRVLE